MPHNTTAVCVPCRYARKGYGPCERCGGPMQYPGRKWSAPKSNNDRAWKRIENGEWLWDRRRVRRVRSDKRNTITKFKFSVEEVEIPDWLTDGVRIVKRKKRIPGSGVEVPNPRRTPDVDMGG